jgi:uncharacterized membrane protein YozB (DUF420 family)
MRAGLIIIGCALIALVLLAVVCGFPAVGPSDPSTVHTIPPPSV